jgi:hypothetical protein
VAGNDVGGDEAAVHRRQGGWHDAADSPLERFQLPHDEMISPLAAGAGLGEAVAVPATTLASSLSPGGDDGGHDDGAMSLRLADPASTPSRWFDAGRRHPAAAAVMTPVRGDIRPHTDTVLAAQHSQRSPDRRERGEGQRHPASTATTAAGWEGEQQQHLQQQHEQDEPVTPQPSRLLPADAAPVTPPSQPFSPLPGSPDDRPPTYQQASEEPPRTEQELRAEMAWVQNALRSRIKHLLSTQPQPQPQLTPSTDMSVPPCKKVAARPCQPGDEDDAVAAQH